MPPFVPLTGVVAALQAAALLLLWAGGGFGGRERAWLVSAYTLLSMAVVGKARLAGRARRWSLWLGCSWGSRGRQWARARTQPLPLGACRHAPAPPADACLPRPTAPPALCPCLPQCVLDVYLYQIEPRLWPHFE